MKRIILDTDIGTNPDDVVALAMLVNSPEVVIEGVTTVYGDVSLRADIARKVLSLAGEEIPVYQGIEQPLLQNREVFWTGLEGKDLDFDQIKREKIENHAVNFMIETIMSNPGEITLVTISPLTNLAAALTLEPRIATNLKEVIIMGGSTRLGENGIEISAYEHNVNCDPEAAQIVFSSPLEILMVGLDVARLFTFNKAVADKLSHSDHALSQLIGSMVLAHMKYMERDFSYLSDAIAVATLLDRSIVETEKMSVTIQQGVNDQGALTICNLDPRGKVDVCLSLDKQKFEDMLFERAFIL